MKMLLVLALYLSVVGCGSVEYPQFESLADLQPRVIEVMPEDGSAIGPRDAVTLKFSRPIDPETIDQRSFAVIAFGGDEKKDDVIADAVDGEVAGLSGKYEMSESGDSTTFMSSDGFAAGASYIVVATHDILSTEMIPLSQHPARSNSPFVSTFSIYADGYDENAPNGGSGGVSSQGSGVDRNRPGNIVINEVLYDVPGSDTDGDVFIELFGDSGGDISGYKIYMVNGEDGVIKDTIKIPENSIIPDDGIFLIADSKTGQDAVSDVLGTDLVDNFDPQNGPDCLQLVDDGERLLDAMAYGGSVVDLAENGLACFEGVPAVKAPSGQSLSRIQSVDTDDNSSDFKLLDVPSPGVL